MLSPSHSKIADLAITGASPRPADPGNTSSKLQQKCETRADLWVPETAHTAFDLVLPPGQAPGMISGSALRLIYLMFSWFLGWLV